jgi:hypothetical protein
VLSAILNLAAMLLVLVLKNRGDPHGEARVFVSVEIPFKIVRAFA